MRVFKYENLFHGVCFFVLLCGCSIEGQWMLEEVKPIEARKDLQFDTLNLQPDGRFYAEVHRDETYTIAGRYTYNETERVLHLKDDKGSEYYFDARITGSGNELELKQYWNGRRMKAEFNRGS